MVGLLRASESGEAQTALVGKHGHSVQQPTRALRETRAPLVVSGVDGAWAPPGCRPGAFGQQGVRFPPAPWMNSDYVYVKPPPGFPGPLYQRGRYAYEHHVVWWQETGEEVLPGFIVHHKNENTKDNRFENLEKATVSKHNAHHGRRPRVVASCGFCGSRLEYRPGRVRRKLKTSVSGKMFCDRSCGARYQWSSRS